MLDSDDIVGGDDVAFGGMRERIIGQAVAKGTRAFVGAAGVGGPAAASGGEQATGATADAAAEATAGAAAEGGGETLLDLAGDVVMGFLGGLFEP